MIITTERDALAPALVRAAHLVLSAGRQMVPILGTVKIEACSDGLQVTSTNLEAQLCERIDTLPRAPYAFAIDAARAAAFVTSLPRGPVTFATKAASIEVSGGRSRARLAAFEAADCPVLRGVGIDAICFEIAASALVRAFRFVLPCVSSEQTRRYLCGCFLHETNGFISAAATDGHRLAVCRIAEGLPMGGVIIPTATIERAVELLPRATATTVSCAVSDRCICFSVGDAILTSKLVDGTFPDYPRGIAPCLATPLVVDRANLLEAVKRVGLVCQGQGASRGLLVRSTGNGLQLSGSEPGGTAEIFDEIDLAGPEVEVGIQI